MNSYTFKNYNWKVFGNVNDGSILNKLKAKDEHRGKLFSFLHHTLGVMNFTAKNAIISFEIKETEIGYSIKIDWTSTKMKSETTLHFLRDVQQCIAIPEHTTIWRNQLKFYMESLVPVCTSIDYRFRLEGSEYLATLRCDISFDQLYSYPKGEDKPDADFTKNPVEFSVPYELIKGVIDEKLAVALLYFGDDHTKLFETLKPLEGKEFLADFLIGATYFLFLELPNKAYAYFERALKIAESQDLSIPPSLLDFMADIQWKVKNNPDEAEHLLLGSLLTGNESGILKLAYLHLQQAQNDKKEIALSLAQIGEQILGFENDADRQKAGYHIVASVYLWNGLFDEAERIQVNFLNYDVWCLENQEIIFSYLILALALDDKAYITNLATDHVFLTKMFPVIFDVWHFEEITPFDQRFGKQFIEVLNLVELAKLMYVA
jgi:hypothetical protein